MEAILTGIYLGGCYPPGGGTNPRVYLKCPEGFVKRFLLESS